jgi:hypothetical protein
MIGDLVATHSSGPARVKWIGHRCIDCRRHPAPFKVWPVRVQAGAFREGVPRRDLWLSPDHAVFAEGVLIPVKHLINGTGVVQEETAEITYFHVELEQHDVLLAEGLPAESYLDTGDRANFANGGVTIALYPDFPARIWDAMGYAPLKVVGPEVATVRQRLATRAAGLSAGALANRKTLRSRAEMASVAKAR